MDLYCDEMDLDPPQPDSRRPLKNLSNAHRHQHSKANRKYAPYSTSHPKGDAQAQTAPKAKQWPSAADNIFAGISMRSYATETHSRRYRPVQHFEHNPWYWNEYAQDVYSHLRDIEKIYRPRTSYMSKQTEINSNMRAILVDWLMEVALDLKLSGETLHMAINYTDRFLSCVRIMRASFQCVGIAALFVASKYEEVNPPFLSDLVEITDRTYTERQVLGMEQKILKVLRFELTIASVSAFAAYFIRATEADERVVAFVNYLSDLTLLDYTFLKFLPSEIAASAVVIALHTFRHTYWTDALAWCTGYQLPHLDDCIRCLHHLLVRAYVTEDGFRGIRGMYSTGTGVGAARRASGVGGAGRAGVVKMRPRSHAPATG